MAFANNNLKISISGDIRCYFPFVFTTIRIGIRPNSAHLHSYNYYTHLIRTLTAIYMRWRKVVGLYRGGHVRRRSCLYIIVP